MSSHWRTPPSRDPNVRRVADFPLAEKLFAHLEKRHGMIRGGKAVGFKELRTLDWVPAQPEEGRQAGRQADGQRGTERDRQTDRQTDGKTERRTGRQRDRQAAADRERERQRERDREVERQRDRQTDRQTDRQVLLPPSLGPPGRGKKTSS